MGQIFVNYRRLDSNNIAHRIYDGLCKLFGSENIILDVDKMPFVDFREHLKQQICNTEVMLVLIGERWLSATKQRANDVNDFVRIGVELALQSNIAVVPILIDAVEMPSANDLPLTLQPLLNKKAVHITSSEDFHYHLEKLAKNLAGAYKLKLHKFKIYEDIKFKAPKIKANQNSIPLSIGTVLQNYRVEKILSDEIFGINYLAKHIKLDESFILKEYLPNYLATRNKLNNKVISLSEENKPIFTKGLDSFLNEAKILFKLTHPNIIRVTDFIESNDTGYMVMKFEEGKSLTEWHKSFSIKKIKQEVILEFFFPLLSALKTIHEKGIIHRNIKPDNILIKNDNIPLLVGFGSAVMPQALDYNILPPVFSEGYTAIEQYRETSEQGPWTDIYSLAAVIYTLISGKKPIESSTRVNEEEAQSSDPLFKLTELNLEGYNLDFLHAIDWALAVNVDNRPHSVLEWKSKLVTSILSKKPITMILENEQPSENFSKIEVTNFIDSIEEVSEIEEILDNHYDQNREANSNTNIALPVNTLLDKKYKILSVLGQGGFGITYLAVDLVLNRKVAIKEYLPTSLATRGNNTQAVQVHGEASSNAFKWGIDRFLKEARILAQLSHPNIVRVLNFMAENETGYMVMEYEQGQVLKEWAKKFPEHRPPQSEIFKFLSPLLEALREVHKAGLAHRDIKPDNIYMRQDDSPVLLDFGSARNVHSGVSHTLAAIVTSGYSPYEQYGNVSEQGPWTDIYAFGAVLYRLITGKTPPDSPSRTNANISDAPDPCEKLFELGIDDYDQEFLNAIDWALQIRIKDRPQNIDEWLEGLYKTINNNASFDEKNIDETDNVYLDEVNLDKYVFISHAGIDKRKIRPVIEALISEKIPVWIDRPQELGMRSSLLKGIKVGKNYRVEIDNALKKASCVIGFWSKNSLSAHRNELIDEMQFGRDKGILIPTLIEHISDLNETLPIGFRQQQYLDLTNQLDKRNSHEIDFSSLIEEVKYIISSDEKTNAPNLALSPKYPTFNMAVSDGKLKRIKSPPPPAPSTAHDTLYKLMRSTKTRLNRLQERLNKSNRPDLEGLHQSVNDLVEAISKPIESIDETLAVIFANQFLSYNLLYDDPTRQSELMHDVITELQATAIITKALFNKIADMENVFTDPERFSINEENADDARVAADDVLAFAIQRNDIVDKSVPEILNALRNLIESFPQFSRDNEYMYQKAIYAGLSAVWAEGRQYILENWDKIQFEITQRETRELGEFNDFLLEMEQPLRDLALANPKMFKWLIRVINYLNDPKGNQ